MCTTSSDLRVVSLGGWVALARGGWLNIGSINRRWRSTNMAMIGERERERRRCYLERRGGQSESHLQRPRSARGVQLFSTFFLARLSRLPPDRPEFGSILRSWVSFERKLRFIVQIRKTFRMTLPLWKPGFDRPHPVEKGNLLYSSRWLRRRSNLSG